MSECKQCNIRTADIGFDTTYNELCPDCVANKLDNLQRLVQELHQAEDELTWASEDGPAHFRKTTDKIWAAQKALRDMVPKLQPYP